ncbi:MAG: hypothetical protein AAF447_18520 [Myxococcota bacterium]
MTGWLAKDFFASSPMLLLPIVALVLFVGAFLAIVARTSRMSRGDAGHHANLVFGDDAEAASHAQVKDGKEAAHG